MVQTMSFIRQFYQKASMKINNLLIHITIDAHPHPAFTFTLQTIAILQLISLIAQSSSQLKLLTFWTEPNNYLPPEFSLIFGDILIIIYVLLLSIRLSQCENEHTLVKPSMCLKYLSTVIAYFRITCQTLVFTPLLVACLKQMMKPTNGMMLGIAVISYMLYFAVVYPILLYCGSGTSILTENKNRKMSILNLELVFNIYKFIFVLSGTLNQSSVVAFGSIFFIIFGLILIKRPFYCFENQIINRAMISTIAFVSIIRVINAMFSQPEGSAFLELVVTICFIFFVEWVANFRLKKILDQEHLTIYQVKCLIFMVQNMQRYIQHLICFIFNHHKKCNNSICKCKNVIDQISNQVVEMNNETIWYEFIISYIHGSFDMKVIDGLPATEMSIKMNKFHKVVFDVAQIYIFKLNKNNIAFLLVSQYRNILKAHHLSSLWSERKNKTFLYYLHQKIDEKCKQQQKANHSAQKYLEFQIQFTKYVGLLLKSAKKFTDFWDQMGKKDPDQPTLLEYLKKMSVWNKNIRKDYRRITHSFTQSKELINPITNDYFELILNVDKEDSMHIIKDFDSQLSKKNKQDCRERKDENTRIYSYDSRTALCFVSVDPASMGKVQFTNQYFDELTYDECGKIHNISDVLLPEIRNLHLEKMQKFVRGDQLNLDHRQIVFLTQQKKIVMSQMMVQVIPSVSTGIRYAIFLKKLQPQRKIICFTERNQYQYISNSMEEVFETSAPFNELSLKNKISLSLADIKSQIDVSWEICDNQYAIRLINYFQTQNKSLLLIQIINQKEEDKFIEITAQIQKGSNKNTFQNSKTNSINSQYRPLKKKLQMKKMSSTYKKKSIFTSMNRNSKELERKEQSSIAQKTYDKLKKEDERIRKNFATLVDIKTERKITRNIFCFIIIFFLLIIAMIICLIAVKKSDYKYYDSARNDFANLNSFIMLMINTATDLQLLNLHTSIPSVNSTFLLDRIKNTPSFTDALDKVISSFQISQIEQSWTALNIMSNKTIQPLVRSNIMTVYDFIQIPINNIAVNFNLSDFNFPISFDYLTAPLTNFEIQFHNFIQNALYVTIPNFLNLGANTLLPLITQKTNRGFPSKLLCIFIIAFVFLFWVIMIICRCRVARVKHQSYGFLESLPIKMLIDKKQKGKHFCSKYSVTEEEDTKQKDPTVAFQSKQSDSQVLLPNISRNISKAYDDLTQRQLDAIGPSHPEMIADTKEKENKPQMMVSSPNRRKQNIFTNTKYCRFIVTISVTLLPLFLFGIVLLALLQKQIFEITSTIALQDGMGGMERQLAAIKLYSFHNGVYSLQFEQYKSISTTLVTNIFIMFNTLQFIMTQFQGTFAPQTLNFINIITGNLCTLDQQGLFRPSNYNFPGRGNLIECESLSNGILKQGYLPSVLHFLQNANRNFLSNPTTFLYNQTQKVSYLNNYFLTNTSLLIDYFILVSETSFHYIKFDLQNTVSWHLNLLIIWGSLYIVVSVIMVTLCRNIFLNFFRDDIDEISTVMTSISCRSVIQNQELKKEFMKNMQTYKIVK